MFQPNDGAPPGYAEADVAQKQSADEVAISVYENQRWFPFKGWGGKRLPTDRPQWSTVDGEPAQPPDLTDNPATMALPEGCSWRGKWEPAVWMYNLDFPAKLQPYVQKKRLTDCVRRRVWSRTVSLPPGGGGGGGGGTNAAQYSTAPGEAGPRTFTVAAKFAGAISSRWTESSGAPFAAVGAVRGTGGGASGGAFPGGWAVVDAGKLFLMAVADSPQALRSVDLKDVANIQPLHALEVGAEHAFQIELDGKGNKGEAGAKLQLFAPDHATFELAANAIRTGSITARALTAEDVKQGIVSSAKTGSDIIGKSMVQAFGWVIGGRVAGRAANAVGL